MANSDGLHSGWFWVSTDKGCPPICEFHIDISCISLIRHWQMPISVKQFCINQAITYEREWCTLLDSVSLSLSLANCESSNEQWLMTNLGSVGPARWWTETSVFHTMIHFNTAYTPADRSNKLLYWDARYISVFCRISSHLIRTVSILHTSHLVISISFSSLSRSTAFESE